MTARWVIGRGLLGRAVIAASQQTPFTADVRWHDPEDAVTDLLAGLDRFVATTGQDRWEIHWCAGRGVTSSPRDVLDVEVDVFHRFVAALTGHREIALDRGGLFLASSVGGIYAGCTDPPFTEATPPCPMSPYGEAKLAMEQHVRAASTQTGLRSFIGRITNLYGPAQDLTKGQGLLSTIVASHLTGRPATIYVSLDTLRDYLYADDCGHMVLDGLRLLAREPAGTSVVKILGSMTPWSIGAILGEASRMHRLSAPIVAAQGPVDGARGQAQDLRVRSEVWTDLDGLARTTLPEGLGALHRAQMAEVMAHGAPTR
ncbi:NAD-dependent epimerase/dehydratase family protein [Aeromicrobium sp.]|uniref:NAD-dependent epimerase/dehydratase family protein n=1 Tax=Aeromicrobium sp. TaxID=1871063 RepID=UPI0025B85D20|nr:NAD-dependent epimerase/dehydratase family protein [Aeromicrobium sp.]MCK5891268.1 NAD-dependent epimerase/dehydratase family protein [Aeromicrobium sp.]